MIKFNTIRFKISLFYVLILGIILISYSYFLYLSLSFVLRSDLDNELKSKVEEIEKIAQSYHALLGSNVPFIAAIQKTIFLENEGPEAGPLNIAQAQWLKDIDRYDLRNDYINFLDASGRSVAATEDMSEQTKQIIFDPLPDFNSQISFKTVNYRRWKTYRVITVLYDFEGKQYAIQLATSLWPVIHLLRARLKTIIFSIPLILIFASFVGNYLALRILRPVQVIASAAERITHEDLSARVIAPHADEEINYLVKAFNDMISRLEEAFKHVSQFSAHVAHELRTPIAVIRGESQVALTTPRTGEEYRRVIEGNLHETNRILKVIEDLLMLASLDFEKGVFQFEKIPMREFLTDICENAKILVSEKQMTVSVEIPSEQIWVHGDPLHLRRLFFNLITNAIRFSPPGSPLSIGVKEGMHRVAVAITDHGEGISEKDLPHIFERFFHRPPKNDAGPAGTGLGLSICNLIARAHGGEITVQSELGQGSTFTLSLPMIPE
jgi:two-component system heavy metal sensor histidine kinase CusS